MLIATKIAENYPMDTDINKLFKSDGLNHVTLIFRMPYASSLLFTVMTDRTEEGEVNREIII